MNESPIKLAFRGKIVFATRNPFANKADATPGNYPAHLETDNEDTQCLGPGLLLCLDHVLTVNQKGFIVHLEPARRFDWNSLPDNVSLHTLDTHSFLVPGMIDLHIHAPQFAYTGTATDRPLMGPNGWLETYTFPSEASLAEQPHLCQQVYQGVVETTLVRMVVQRETTRNSLEAFGPRLNIDSQCLSSGHGNDDSCLLCNLTCRTM